MKNSTPKEVVVSRWDYECHILSLLGAIVLICLILSFVFHVLGIGLILCVTCCVFMFLVWMIPKICMAKESGKPLRQVIEEENNKVLFSVQKWGMIINTGPITYRLYWNQIRRMYEDYVVECYPRSLPARYKYLYVKTSIPGYDSIRCTNLDFLGKRIYKTIEDAVTYYSKGTVPYVKYTENRKRKR